MYIPQSDVDKFWGNVGNVFAICIFAILGLLFICIFIYAAMSAISTIPDAGAAQYKVCLAIAAILFISVNVAFIMLVYSYSFEHAPKGSVPVLQAIGWPLLWISMIGGVLFRIIGEDMD